jgi:MSHA pilin protein MshC
MTRSLTGHRRSLPSSGFTLVEILSVLVIAGILVAVAMGRLIDGDSFNPSVAASQIISVSRNAQQSALGKSPVTLTITPSVSGDTVTLRSAFGAGAATTIEQVELAGSGVSLTGDINNTASCESSSASAISNAAPMTIAFGELGNLASTTTVNGATGTAISSGLRICVNSSAAYSVCVSPSGYAYGGDCDS